MRKNVLVPLAISLTLTVGCAGSDPAYDLKAFSSCDQLVDTLQDQAITEIRWDSAWGNFGSGFGANDFAIMESGVGAPQASDSAGDGERGYSGTNNQVEGVDELDIMETDGEFIYAIAGDHLMVSKVWPPEEAAVSGNIQIEGRPKGLFLLEDKTVVVLSQLGWGEDGAPLSG
jgi:uncharacterized secreted protein with C-terminal beta-propeller domain